MRAARGHNNMNHMDKKFLVPLHPLSNIKITRYFNYKPRFNGLFSRDNLPRIKIEPMLKISMTNKSKEHT